MESGRPELVVSSNIDADRLEYEAIIDGREICILFAKGDKIMIKVFPDKFTSDDAIEEIDLSDLERCIAMLKDAFKKDKGSQ